MNPATNVVVQPQPQPWRWEELVGKLLSPLTAVRPGEVRQAIFVTLAIFTLLSTYYVLKTAREALILTQGGAEIKSYSSAWQALLLLIIVPLYGMLAARAGRVLLVGGITLFFASHLLFFSAAGFANIAIGVPFFLWVGVFNVLIIAQAWSFANDLYSEEAGKRLFPLFGLGASLGALVGAQGGRWLIPALGINQVLLVSAIPIVVTVLLIWLANRNACTDCPIQNRESKEPLDGPGGFQLIARDRYLLLIAVLVVLLNVANTMGEFVLSKSILAEADRVLGADASKDARQRFIGAFYGDFFSAVNLGGLLLQTFLVSRILQWTKVRGALFVLPALSMISSLTYLVAPMFAVFRTLKTLENAVDYSLQGTTRQALFLITSRDAKYKAKAAIDAFFWRLGDMVAAGLVFLGAGAGLSISGYLSLNLGVGIVLTAIATLLFLEHRRRTAA